VGSLLKLSFTEQLFPRDCVFGLYRIKLMTSVKAAPSLCAAVMIGDSYGLPNEGLPARAIKLFRRIPLPWRPTSDDSEHTLLVLDAINRSSSAEEFRQRLAWNLRWWFLSLPIAVGLATAKSGAKLWFGAKRGVYSAGNGPCMRIPALIAKAPPEQLKRYIEISTTLTHTDPKALWACEALAYVLLHSELIHQPLQLLSNLRDISAEPAWTNWVTLAIKGIDAAWEPADFAHRIGSTEGISGYALHTVPVVVYTWLRAKGAATALNDVVLLGGDTDSAGALIAALVSRTDPEGLSTLYPSPKDWPVNQSTLQHLEAGGGLDWTFYPSLLLRNLISLPAYLIYALIRRLG